MTSTNSSGGTLGVTFDEPVRTVQGEEITVVSKIAYGRQGGSYMDYSITDSNGIELIDSHICVYSSSGAQSLRIGGEELLGSGLPAGITTSNRNNDGILNGYTTFTATLSPDTNTITLTVSNDEGETTFTGSFPDGTSCDVGALNFSTTQTYASRSCYVDGVSITKTKAPSYTIGFEARNMKLTLPEGIVPEETYVIEMDLGMSSGNSSMSEFAVITSDTDVPNNGNVTGGYLFKLSSTEKSYSNTTAMPWTVNDNADDTVTFTQNGTNPTWAHLKMTVDPSTGEVHVVLTENEQEIYNKTLQAVDTSSNAVVGFNFKAGRAYSKGQFDNIRIYTADQTAE